MLWSQSLQCEDVFCLFLLYIIRNLNFKLLVGRNRILIINDEMK